MRTITTNVYHFDELSKVAQAYAVDSCRLKIGGMLSDWDSEDYKETLSEVERLLGISVGDYSIDQWFYTFKFGFVDSRWSDLADNEDVKYLVRYINSINDSLMRKCNYVKNIATIEGERKFFDRESHIFKEYDHNALTGLHSDSSVVRNFMDYKHYIKNGYTVRAFVEDILQDLFCCWQNEIKEDYDDDSIIEDFYNNDYEFTEDGKLYN